MHHQVLAAFSTILNLVFMVIVLLSSQTLDTTIVVVAGAARLNCIQTKAASPQIVELLTPNIYSLFTLFSFNCGYRAKKVDYSLEQIIGQGKVRKF